MESNSREIERVYEAALEGHVDSLLNLLQEDSLILDRCLIGNKSTQTPLHVAASQGHLEMVKALVAVNPHLCLARDQDGRNPLHIAALKGHLLVVDELLRTNPRAAHELTHAAETVLHVCVKHAQFETLQLLVTVLDDGDLLNFKDGNGNTVLHLAVASKQPQMVKFILKDKRIIKNWINKNGLTAMDICKQSRKDQIYLETWRSLKRAKALTAKVASRPRNMHHTWLDNQRNALMIVSSLIATMAFQVGVSPPGGAWQDDLNEHQAGKSIMASKNKTLYDELLIFSTMGLVSSLSVILLLISGLPFRRLFVGVLMITMWIALTATVLTYVAAVNFMSGTDLNFDFPKSKQHRAVWNILIADLTFDFIKSKQHRAVRYILIAILGAWLLFLLVLVLGHVIRVLVKLVKQFVSLLVKLCKKCYRVKKVATPPPIV